MKKKEFVVYQIKNLINQKLYIGITINLKKRMNGHFNCPVGREQYIHHSIKKHGKENFETTIIDYGNSWKELEDKEKYWIKKLDTYKNGYNQTKGGDGTFGFIPGKESRKKMSESAKGKKATKEARSNMSKAQKGRIVSEEARKNISKAGLGRVPWNKGLKTPQETKDKISKANKGKESWNKGTKCSEETKKKISDNNKGKTAWNKGKSGYLSEEARKKISKANTGRIFSQETKDKISKANKGKESWIKGKTHSEETKKKMSKSRMGNIYNLGKKQSEKTKKQKRDLMRKFSDCQIKEIRVLLKNGIAQKQIAKIFGVEVSTINRVNTGKIYSDIN